MRTSRQLSAVASALMRIGRKGGYSSNSRASENILLRTIIDMKRCISGMRVLLAGSYCCRAGGAGVASAAMRTMHQWLDEYGASHRNPINELVHWICVPT